MLGGNWWLWHRSAASVAIWSTVATGLTCDGVSSTLNSGPEPIVEVAPVVKSHAEYPVALAATTRVIDAAVPGSDVVTTSQVLPPRTTPLHARTFVRPVAGTAAGTSGAPSRKWSSKDATYLQEPRNRHAQKARHSLS